MTFIVAFLRSSGVTEPQIAAFWAILGAAAVLAAFVWGPILARIPAGRGVFVVLLVLLLGAVLPLAASGAAAAFASAAPFLAVVTAVTHVARQATPPASWTHVIGALTVAFALGQCAWGRSSPARCPTAPAGCAPACCCRSSCSPAPPPWR